jgi:hypothetical protein
MVTFTLTTKEEARRGDAAVAATDRGSKQLGGKPLNENRTFQIFRISTLSEFQHCSSLTASKQEYMSRFRC